MLCDELVKLRDKARLTNKQLASIAGVSEATLTRIFSGATQEPSFVTVAQIVSACGGSLDDIAGITPPDRIDQAQHDALKAQYEQRIAAIEAEHRQHIERVNEFHAERARELNDSLKDLRRRSDRKLYFILALTAVLIVVVSIIGNDLIMRTLLK